MALVSPARVPGLLARWFAPRPAPRGMPYHRRVASPRLRVLRLRHDGGCGVAAAGQHGETSELPQSFDCARLRLPTGLVRGLAHDMGVSRPNGMQGAALLAAGRGQDVLVCAQTGSGKTLTFLLPMLARLAKLTRADSLKCRGGGSSSGSSNETNSTMAMAVTAAVKAVVVAPTEELVAQHAEVAHQLAQRMPHPPAVVTGVLSAAAAAAEWQRGRPVVLVATPAQLLALPPQFRLAESLEVVALDEVDALLCGPAGDSELSPVGRELLLTISRPDGVGAHPLSFVVSTGVSQCNVINLVTKLRKVQRTAPGSCSDTQRLQWLMATAYLDTAHSVLLSAHFPAAARVDQAAGDRAVLVPGLKQVFHYFGGGSSKESKLAAVLERASADPFLAVRDWPSVLAEIG
jgi:hypothetical protein